MKNENRQQTARVTVRMFPEVKKQLENEAANVGLSASGLMKFRTFGEAAAIMPTKQKVITPDLKLLRQVLGALGKWGNNLNQISHHLNKSEGYDSEKISLKLIEHNLKQIRKAVLSMAGVN